jgi:hypothetical protein
MKQLSYGLALYWLMAMTVHAGDNDIDVQRLPSNQAFFKDLVDEMGAAMSYKAVAPAEPLGTVGFDIGLELTATKMEKEAWKRATVGDASTNLYVPKIHVHKGLPAGFNIGAYYGKGLDSNVRGYGGELRYALLSGGALSPALAVRGSYTRLNGVNDLDLSTTGLEVSISKGFAMLTPYGGIGAVWIDSSSSQFDPETSTVAKYFLGLNFNLGLVNFAAEADRTGDNTSGSAKLGVRF